MNDDKPIDYESEHNKAINKLVKLRQKYDELEEDRDYVKSLLDVEFEKRIKLQKENEQLKTQLQNTSDQRDEFHRGARENANRVGELERENEQLKNELKEFKDYVYSDEKILCYSCVNCFKKGIYEVECSEKGKVDVHGTCFLYWKNEVKE